MIALNLVAPIKLLRGFAGAMKEHRYGKINLKYSVDLGQSYQRQDAVFTVRQKTGFME